MKLLVTIPAYNEEKMIGTVVQSIPKKIKGISQIKVLVVDDGSEDETGKKAKSAGATVITHLINRGVGGAMKTIFSYAQKINANLLVTLDADGQHNPGDIEKIVSPILTKKVDVTIGVRWSKFPKDAIIRYSVNKIANILTYFLTGLYTNDSQSGFRAYNKKAIDKITILTDGMEVSSEICYEIKNKNLLFAEVPIKPIYTKYSLNKGQKISNAPNVMTQLLLRFLR